MGDPLGSDAGRVMFPPTFHHNCRIYWIILSGCQSDDPLSYKCLPLSHYCCSSRPAENFCDRAVSRRHILAANISFWFEPRCTRMPESSIFNPKNTKQKWHKWNFVCLVVCLLYWITSSLVSGDHFFSVLWRRKSLFLKMDMGPQARTFEGENVRTREQLCSQYCWNFSVAIVCDIPDLHDQKLVNASTAVSFIYDCWFLQSNSRRRVNRKP